VSKITLDIVEYVIRIHLKAEGAAESPPASNAGPFVERVLAVPGNKAGDPWCMADISDTGKIALGRLWPLPLTASCQLCADYCKTKGVLVATPQRGDLWFKWHPELKRFGHVGLVLSVAPDMQRIQVSAGNTIRPGQPGDTREGWLQWTRTESVAPLDRFGRWITLLPDDITL